MILVSSGVRRVEALTGIDANVYFQKKIDILNEIKKELKATDENVLKKLLEIKKEFNNLKSKSIKSNVLFSNSNIIKIKKHHVYYDDLKCNPKDLRNNSDEIKKLKIRSYYINNQPRRKGFGSSLNNKGFIKHF